MNNELDFLTNLFSTDNAAINLLVFLQGVLITTLLSLILGYVYVRLGNSLSNRRNMAKTLVLISLTTMLIITIVKSSLALSLGLVGALSIVRFRTAIKEPEELAYFFMSISIGLGIGAGQFLATIIGASCIFIIIFFLSRKKPKDFAQNLIVQFDTPKSTQELKRVIAILEDNCSQIELRRMDENNTFSEISFAVSFDDFPKLLNAREHLQEAFPGIKFSFLNFFNYFLSDKGTNDVN